MNLHITFGICWKKRDLANFFLIVFILPTENITNADRNQLFFTMRPSLSMCEFLSTSPYFYSIKNKKHTAASGIRKPCGWHLEVVVIGHRFHFLFSCDPLPLHFCMNCTLSRWRQLLFSSLILLDPLLKDMI